MAPALEDMVHRLALTVVELVDLQDLPEADHGVKGGAQLVAHPRQELTLGLVRRLGCFLRVSLCLFGPATVVDVDDVPEHRHDPAVLVGLGDEHGRHPPERPVTAIDPVLADLTGR